MGRFANQTEGQGTRLGPKPARRVDASGFDALGHPVPMYRRAAGYEAMKQMGCTDKDKMVSCIEAMSDRIARDEPHAAMELALEHIDATGVYRLLACLLDSPKPVVRVPAKSVDADGYPLERDINARSGFLTY